ncbi:MAG: ABC transporter ATP-binding protein [Anaerolineae bacterium]|jgi:ABC-type Fe3+/spermidine/putrescine transport system ATPase subunit
MALLQVISISKAFAGTPVLRDVSFVADEGEVVCLLGPSGCGKTTLLRIIAGLEAADSGEVIFDGQSLEGVPAHRRGFGLMFQDFALFPHKDVAANVAFGLRMQARSRQKVEGRVSEMLDLVGMEGYRERRVYDLSGGEQQRVALARSLAPNPRLLMLDEPLGSLDRALREDLMNELRTILKRVGVTSIYVTHDQQEAFAVSDRVILMRRGSVVQLGTPRDLYFRPASPWVARFLGLTNLLTGQIVATQAGPDGQEAVMVSTALGELPLQGVQGFGGDQEVTVLIRPEAARLAGERCAEDEFVVNGIVRGSSFRGSQTRLEVRFSDGVDLVFELASGGLRLPSVSERVSLVLRPEGLSLLVGGSL